MPRQRTTSRPQSPVEQSRLLPISIAGLICFLIALILGYGGWYLFGSRRQTEREHEAEVVQVPAIPQSTPAPTPQKILAPAGELQVAGGEVTLGGGDTGIPLRRDFVKPFAIAETEITNEQYRDFVVATGHKAPAGWKDNMFPPGAALEPVTGVSWQDAADYCKWVSEKIGAAVDLPTEAEWELAAKGKESQKYPWGNDWKASAATSKEAKGQVRAVKSYPDGRSPSGAYDMAGNVWEWTVEDARDENNQAKKQGDVPMKIIKGGSANEPQEFINSTSRFEMPSNKTSRWLGFRYVVRREPEQAQP